ncbi:MAG TPA: gamma-glutamyltransferase, partial [Blastocatellia bacterium]|nr:gamma-glutamyltransferase [Blastocatellia bacterium]
MPNVILLGRTACDNQSRLTRWLQTAWDIVPLSDEKDGADLQQALPQASAFIGLRWKREWMEGARQLRLVQALGAGVDAYDVAALPPGCALCNVYEHGVPVSEYVIGAMVALTARFAFHDARLRQGRWDGSGRLDGAPHTELAGQTVGLIEDILRFSPESRELFVPEGELLAEGDLLFAPDLAAFLASVAAGEIDALDSPGFAGPLLRLSADGCRITADDLADYEPVWRHPLQSQHNGWRVDTNPAPAFGGQIIAAALRSVDGSGPAAMTAALRDATAAAKNGDAPLAVTGTTQISIADADGMVVSMTTTNGAGGGVMVPDTGIHL